MTSIAQTPAPVPAPLAQRAPILTIEPDVSLARRLVLAACALALSISFGLSAIDAFRAGKPGLMPIGFGRLCDFLLARHLPGAGVLALIERGHLALSLLAATLLLVAGGSPMADCGDGKQMVFHRRASARRQIPILIIGLALLGVGQWLAVAVHPVVAGIVEVPAMWCVGWVLWSLVIPESRVALTVISDKRQGFSNMMILSGGPFNRNGSITVRHDQLEEAGLFEPAWTRMFRFRDLALRTRQLKVLRIDAIAPRAELAELIEYLNGDFIRAQSRDSMNFTNRNLGHGGQWH